MSNSILPHLLSDSPPPLEADDEDFDDEFGDFKGPEELSFDNELPSTPTLDNSKNHFHDFSTCIHDNGYDGFKNETKEDSINSLPPKKYYSLWEQIENNVPDFVDNNEKGKNNDISQNLVGEVPGKIAIHELCNADQLAVHVNNCNKEIQELSEHELSVESNEEFPNKISQNSRYVDTTSPEDSYSSQDKEFDYDTPPETHIDKIQLDNLEVNENQFTSTESTADTLVCKTERVEKSTSISNKTEKNEDSISIENINEAENYTSERLKLDSSEFAVGHEADDNKFHLKESFDFPADFKPSEFSSDIRKVSIDISEPTGEPQLDVDEFADFSCYPIKSNDNFPCEKGQVDQVETFEDDFNEFESYQENILKTDSNVLASSPAFEENIKNEEKEEVDEFDDFTCYSAHHEDSVAENLGHSEEVFKICESPQEGFEKTCDVVEKIFPKIESTTQEYLNFDFISSNTVFENLKDITETSALSYQWDKSVAQKNLLKTLNIDVRNILYGPTWNSGVPIFAANLCEKPLEPIRSELPIPTSPQKTSEPQESAPSYPQFDWAASGLSDLQDSVENVTNEKPETLQESSNAGIGIIQPSYVEVNLPSGDESKHKEEKISLHKNQKDTDDFSDFTSYQEIEEEKEESKKWNSMLPLRESHISINSQQESTETNEISRYFQDLTTGRTEALGISQLKTNSKFSFCNTQLQSLRNDQLSAESLTMFNELEKNSNKIPDQVNLTNKPVTSKVSIDRDIVKNSHLDEDSKENHINPIIMPSNYTNNHKEDEFTDFQSSLPCSKPLVVASILSEPLKPAVLLPEPVKHQPLKIEWPDPGLDEEEISRIVNGVLRKNSKSESVSNKVDSKTTENSIKPLDQRADQDDWSDFMSVKEPLKARTSTPDLPLSVFNLGNIQPNRSSAPYVAPNGVVHSPSKTTTMSFPIISRNTQNNSQQQSHQQPFITTQAFNALYSNTKNNIFLPNSSVSNPCNMNPNSSHSLNNDKMDSVQKNPISFSLNDRINHKVPQHVPSSIYHSNSEDDDWGDFVSAPSTVSQSHSNANFFQSLSYIKTNLGLSGKGGSVQKSSPVSKNTVVRQEKNNLPIISTMPDLEFVSPKSRSSIK